MNHIYARAIGYHYKFIEILHCSDNN